MVVPFSTAPLPDIVNPMTSELTWGNGVEQQTWLMCSTQGEGYQGPPLSSSTLRVTSPFSWLTFGNELLQPGNFQCSQLAFCPGYSAC
jgi:hypothetical protein